MLDMRLSARADYALRAAVELAAADGGHVTAEQLARAQHIPGKFLEAILTQLRRARLIATNKRNQIDVLDPKGLRELVDGAADE